MRAARRKSTQSCLWSPPWMNCSSVFEQTVVISDGMPPHGQSAGQSSGLSSGRHSCTSSDSLTGVDRGNARIFVRNGIAASRPPARTTSRLTFSTTLQSSWSGPTCVQQHRRRLTLGGHRPRSNSRVCGKPAFMDQFITQIRDANKSRDHAAHSCILVLDANFTCTSMGGLV
jgi:hypothetical protein